VLPSLLLSLFQAGLLASVSVQGGTSCPDPSLVTERLRQLLPAPSVGEGGEVARIDPTSDGLQVRLLRADGSVAGERLLRGQHPCDQLADAAAVMIATWMDSGASAPGLQAPPLADAALGVRASPATPRRGWDLGASLGGSLNADGASPAAEVSAGADVLGRVLGLRLAAVLTGWSETPLGDQAARWRRTSLTLAPRVRRSLSFLTGELHAGPSLAWLQVEGRGFSAAETRRDGALIFGMTGGARLALSRARLQPFLAGSLAFWPVRSLVYALPEQTTSALPRTQLLLTLGVSYQHQKFTNGR
jgi:hypothetical protein